MQTSSTNNANKAYNINKTGSRFLPVFDSFTLLAITLAVIIGIVSYYFNKKSKRSLKTIRTLQSNI